MGIILHHAAGDVSQAQAAYSDSVMPFLNGLQAQLASGNIWSGPDENVNLFLLVMTAVLGVALLAMFAWVLRLLFNIKDIENDMELSQAMMSRDGPASQRLGGIHTISCLMRGVWRLLFATVCIGAVAGIAVIIFMRV
jgi:hypothetical protein